MDQNARSAKNCAADVQGILEGAEMTEREKIFARIREALTVPAPVPGHHSASAQHAPASEVPSTHAREWLPPVGDSFEDQLARFRANAVDLKATFYFCNSHDELAKLLIELRDAEGWKKVASHGGELTDAACKTLAL